MRRQRALTIVELIFVLGVAIFLITVLMVIVGHSFNTSRRTACRENQAQIGRALTAYALDHGGYYPFAWLTADGQAPAQAAPAMTSLGCLYPDYLAGPGIFRCPATDDTPDFAPRVARPAKDARDRTRTLTGGSYGYDPRLAPRGPQDRILFADMDGTNIVNPASGSANHEDGQNVLFLDGHVAWSESNHCSDNPDDNIYTEDPWNADTDTYLLRQDAPLGASFLGYDSLHPH